jgi:ribosome-binding protein aMBF1 (putative translation factor)
MNRKEEGREENEARRKMEADDKLVKEMEERIKKMKKDKTLSRRNIRRLTEKLKRKKDNM